MGPRCRLARCFTPKKTPATLPDKIGGAKLTRCLSLAWVQQGEVRRLQGPTQPLPEFPPQASPKPSAAVAQPLHPTREWQCRPHQLLLSSPTLRHPPFLCPGFSGPSALGGSRKLEKGLGTEHLVQAQRAHSFAARSRACSSSAGLFLLRKRRWPHCVPSEALPAPTCWALSLIPSLGPRALISEAQDKQLHTEDIRSSSSVLAQGRLGEDDFPKGVSVEAQPPGPPPHPAPGCAAPFSASLPFPARPRSCTASCPQMRCTWWILGGNTGMYSLPPLCLAVSAQTSWAGQEPAKASPSWAGILHLRKDRPGLNEPEHPSHLHTSGLPHSGKHTEARRVGLPV